jgi:hypothetical protein
LEIIAAVLDPNVDEAFWVSYSQGLKSFVLIGSSMLARNVTVVSPQLEAD